ncbi:MAG: molybdenum cofactor biosynthesis protein MoaE [Opitutaceae bacterium]|nr:molybdenum cofactor biosynthesis protein MoaE [Opitutaceae bacterium]
MTFRISTTPLDPPTLARDLLDLRAGAYVEFQGWVRNHNEDQAVQALEYEAYVALAEKEGARILAEVATRHAILGAACVHRTGLLQLGELAVWVGVTAAHRGAAFEACRAIIDETKARVPIWKKEHYTSGATGWINCATRGDFATPAAPQPQAGPG